MGADLYLDSIFEPFFESHGDPKTTHADWEASGGYFRNGYNAGDVMWAMGLSWDLVIDMLDENGHLPIAHARELVTMIEARPLTRKALASHFLENMADGHDKHPVTGGLVNLMNATIFNGEADIPKTLPPEFESFESFLVEKRVELIAFLKKSIALGEPIACSL